MRDRATAARPAPRECVSATWGTTAEERALPYPCDGLLERPDDVLFRGVTVAAPPARVFRWLCQLRAAPYSYDWIDHWGRRSPTELTPGLEDLAAGQRAMTIFTVVSFRPDDHLTLRTRPPATGAFGEVGVTYRVVPVAPASTRLLVKLEVTYPPGLAGALLSRLLPWGDLVMMRRQLLNLKALAESGT